ncbi:hypothetical protein QYS48_14020 [Marivirga arenosa]|uniref:Choloylglycine hydrolase/NAAA C-terminal domain-containing protein n=1 Tax=Marivirga arenosa TaxID=3059076 RepID=A0AA49JD64_9BACT|nr:hypothetical protein [Marivirga sp. ABR2-2]WKK83456.2 hypothetical protein QYS48_14020 [Marivirga sp. ABR2-2]
MYKITADGKTMVGCNHDAWLSTPKVWFENAKQANGYGAAFTGARQVSNNRTTPQSGMNTSGLIFSRLASYYPIQNNPFTDRLKVSDEADYLTNILHKCASVKEVRKYIEQYDHSFFINDVFIYIDSLGNYLIVEPYNLIEGNNPNYVLANFCPSITDNEQARKLERYRKGEDFLKTNEAIPSLAFCRTLSDSMSVCRKRNGDGTLLTSIWDTKDKMVSLYFYHSYDTVVQYNLKEELAKGDHTINVPEIFPRNSDFEKLINYKTPSNTIELRILLVVLAVLLAFFPFMLAISKFWKKKFNAMSIKSILTITVSNLLLIAYIFVLITNKNIFYFDAPYKHYKSNIISAFSYTPFLLLVLFGSILFYMINSSELNKTKLWIKTILALNNLIYIFLIVGFAYWGLYNIWT